MSDKYIYNKIKEIGKHSIIYGLGSIAQSAAGFILLPLYAKHLSPNEFGIFSLIQIIGVVFGTVFYFGASSALPRSYYDYTNNEDRKKVFNTTLLLLLIGAVAQISIGALFSDTISKIIIGSTEYNRLVFVQIVSSSMMFLNAGFFVYMRLLRKSIIVLIINIINLLLTVIIVYYLLVIRQAGIEAPIYALLISQSIKLIFYIFYLRNVISIFSILSNEIPIQLKFGIASVFASVSLMIFEYGDKLIINKLMHTSDVGIYSMGFRLAMLYNILITAPFTMIWQPMMMEYQNDKNIKVLFEKVTYYYTLVSILYIIFSFLFLGDLLIILGFNINYDQSIIIVPYLVIGLYFSSLLNIFSAGVFYSRTPIILTYIYIPVGGISILLNVILIPILGIWGAVIAAIISKLILAGAVYVVSGKYFRYNLNYIRYLKILVVVSAIALIKYSTVSLYPNNMIINIGLFVLFIIISYHLLLSANERKYLDNSINKVIGFHANF